MATVFLTRQRGMVAKIKGPWSQLVPFTLRIPKIFGAPGSMQRMFLTRTGLNAQDIVQLQETMGDDVFAYVFGAGISDATVGGYAFAPCGDSRHGILDLFDAYNANRVGTTGKATYLDIGGRAFPAILVGMNVELNDPVSAIVQFSLSLKVLPT